VIPKVQYAQTSSGLVAYQVFGRGPLEIVMCEGFGSQLEVAWEHPTTAAVMEGLASFARVAFLDQRGVGLSDNIPHQQQPTWEDAVEDFRVVADAAGMKRPAVFVSRSAVRPGLLFAATQPDRVSALILVNGTAYFFADEGYPGHSPEAVRQIDEWFRQGWGTEEFAIQMNPSLASDPAAVRWLARMMRASCSPGRAFEAMQHSRQFDVRPFLSAIRVPTLMLHTANYRFAPLPMARYMAERISGAKLVVFPGSDTTLDLTHTAQLWAHIKELLTGAAVAPDADRILATLVFADLVGSSDVAARIGDRRWKETQQQFFAIAREEAARFGGREVDTAGDGYFAAFDGPGRAVRFAERVRSRMEDVAQPLRFGIHVGECERVGDKLTGLAVNIGARVCAKADPGEILVSGTVRDLLMGSGVKLQDRGSHELKGIPGHWPLLAVAA
jgi:class 3 adenylate cyclase